LDASIEIHSRSSNNIERATDNTADASLSSHDHAKINWREANLINGAADYNGGGAARRQHDAALRAEIASLKTELAARSSECLGLREQLDLQEKEKEKAQQLLLQARSF
jgi:hypothetical protein